MKCRSWQCDGLERYTGKIHLIPYVLLSSYNLLKQIGAGRGRHKGCNGGCPIPAQLQISYQQIYFLRLLQTISPCKSLGPILWTFVLEKPLHLLCEETPSNSKLSTILWSAQTKLNISNIYAHNRVSPPNLASRNICSQNLWTFVLEYVLSNMQG